MIHQYLRTTSLLLFFSFPSTNNTKAMTSTLLVKITQASTCLNLQDSSSITTIRCRQSTSILWDFCLVTPAQCDRNAPHLSITLDSPLSICSQEDLLMRISGMITAAGVCPMMIPRRLMDAWESRRISTMTSCTPMLVFIIFMEIARLMCCRREKCSLKDARKLLE